MVDTDPIIVISPNGDRRTLPDLVTLTMAEMQQFPSPGTQRALKAETGQDYMELVGPKADSADRTQTQIWQHLRKTIRDLRWAECDEVTLQIADKDVAVVDPTQLASAVPSPDSVASGE
jgi:flavin-binding protein dodecin